MTTIVMILTSMVMIIYDVHYCDQYDYYYDDDHSDDHYCVLHYFFGDAEN